MSTYLAESTLADDADGRQLDLSTALATTPDGLAENPEFFSGFVDRPDVLAAGLLAVADVAASRYVDFGLAKRVANLDPVVTGSGDRMRFEAFSECNGVYARFDLLAGGLGGTRAAFGTTNIDINQPLRTALATISRTEALHLSVGRTELRASTLAATHVERKVSLPDRWVRGFAEVPQLTRAMRPIGELTGPAAQQLFAIIPRVAPPGPTVYLVPHGPRWLVSRRAVPGAVSLAGASRVRGADRVLRLASRLRIFSNPHGASAWVFDLPGARFNLVVSPGPYRAFSGEGSLLDLLASPRGAAVAARLLALIGWESSVDPGQLGERTGLSDQDIAAGLAWLAASGRLGFDLNDQAWFHRELPVDHMAVLRRNPRLVSAQKLVLGGAVAKAGANWTVTSGVNAYTVSNDLHCDCPWKRDHQHGRGPCKHVLAVLLYNQAETTSATAQLH